MLEIITPPQSTTTQQQNYNHQAAAQGASKDPTVLPKGQAVQANVKSQKTENDQFNAGGDEGRKAKVEQAARHFIANMYAVSDHSLTIFKDSTGQYITRIRNLKDGRVSYYPEPDMLRMSHPFTGDTMKMVAIEA